MAGGEHEVSIEKLVFGGEGLALVEGRAVLVPASAAGDRLRVRITRVGRRVARAEILEILSPSPRRRTPPCRHFGECGGCQLQHVEYAAQLEAKGGFVRDCLRRIAGIRWDGAIEVLAAGELGYRSRAEMHVGLDAAGRRRLGYFRAASGELCEVEECPILVPALGQTLARLRAEPDRIPARAERLAFAAGDDGAVAIGHGAIRQRIAGIEYSLGAESFLQANRLLVEDLVRVAVGEARGTFALDLYSGAGLFALQLAGRFETVHAVEEDPAAAALGRENARANGIGNVRWAEVCVEGWLDSERERLPRPDLVLLDPPRGGAGRGVVEKIAALAAREVVYVSCDPATLARDLRAFGERGWRIASLVALDLFPQTYHVETVVRLVATGLGAPAAGDDGGAAEP